MEQRVRLHKSRPVLEASPENHQKVERRVRLLSPVFQTLLYPWHRITSEGQEHIPRDGPFLLLANHVATLDPITLILASKRQVHFMATRSLMQEPVLSRVMQIAAVVPRKKFTSDSRSVRKLRAWRDVGAAVGLFPEGTRTWDGKNLPLLPGIEKLIRLMRVPVVTARIVNAYRQAPRWGTSMRHGRVHVEFDPPKTFDRRADPAMVRAYVEARIQVDPTRGWPVSGRNLAHGLSNVLYACPLCFAIDGLVEHANTLTCSSCAAHWRLDPDHILHGSSAPVPVSEALTAVHNHLHTDWIADPSLHAGEGIVLQSEPGELFDISEDELRPMAKGRLTMTESHLEMRGEGGWRVALADVSVVAIDMRRRLQLRTDAGAVEVFLPTESVVKWLHWMEHWRTVAGAPNTGIIPASKRA